MCNMVVLWHTVQGSVGWTSLAIKGASYQVRGEVSCPHYTRPRLHWTILRDMASFTQACTLVKSLPKVWKSSSILGVKKEELIWIKWRGGRDDLIPGVGES